MKNLNLPTAETLAQHVTWTGLSLIELVNADRIRLERKLYPCNL